MTPSEMLNKYKLADVPCQGCGKTITVAIPFTGCPFCSDCIKPQIWKPNAIIGKKS